MTAEEQERAGLQDSIDEVGFQMIDITDDNYLPPYVYTLGLSQQFNHPEIICFGLSSEVIQSFLTIAKDKIEEGEIFEPHKPYTGFLDKNVKVYFLPVDENYLKDYLGYADWFYKGENYSAMQLVWPDKRGNFPWDKKFDQNLEFAQPLLDRNIDFRFYESKKLGVFTTQNILNGELIRYVIHDEEGDWFFLENDQVDNDDIQIVSLEQIVKIDPTINTIYYLQYGWEATREDRDAEWEEIESELGEEELEE